MKLMDYNLRTYLASSTGMTTFSQRLVRMICKHCREPYMPPRELVEQFSVEGQDPDDLSYQQGIGCSHCNETGYFHRTGVFEMLGLDNEMRDAFLSGTGTAAIRELGRKNRLFLSLREAGLIQALKGITTLEEIYGILSYSERRASAAFMLAASDSSYWMDSL